MKKPVATLSNERRCIAEARDMRIFSVRRRLQEFNRSGIPFSSPVAGVGIMKGNKWKKQPALQARKVLLLPITLIFDLLLVLWVPVAYLMHLRDVRRAKHSLEIEMERELAKPEDFSRPSENTLAALWQLHGLDESKYDQDMCLQLLSQWVGFLYGEEIANSIDLKSRVTEIAANYARANQPYYDRDIDANHYSFIPPVESLILDLSDELPKYVT